MVHIASVAESEWQLFNGTRWRSLRGGCLYGKQL